MKCITGIEQCNLPGIQNKELKYLLMIRRKRTEVFTYNNKKSGGKSREIQSLEQKNGFL